MDTNNIDLLTVGVDVGSSTSHLVFSKLHLERDEQSESRRFFIRDRNVIYECRIIDTPLVNPETIDVDRLSSFLKDEYKRAGIAPEDIQTGAVIITGETAKKQNAKTDRIRFIERCRQICCGLCRAEFRESDCCHGVGSRNPVCREEQGYHFL